MQVGCGYLIMRTSQAMTEVAKNHSDVRRTIPVTAREGEGFVAKGSKPFTQAQAGFTGFPGRFHGAHLLVELLPLLRGRDVISRVNKDGVEATRLLQIS